MAAVVGLTIVKKFTYRGNATEEFSNQYWLSGAVPADPAGWLALFNALVAQEKTVYSSRVSVIAGYGYDSDADNAHAVYVNDLAATPVAGTLVTGGVPSLPGDSAVLLSWKTSRLNTRGKPIYLRKYFHDAYSGASTVYDTILGAQSAALAAFGTKLMDGSFLDARKLRSRLHDETLLSRIVDPYITTRTLKRRGKRPTSA